MKVLSDELQVALLGVLRLWDVSGANTFKQQALRFDWPDLAQALDELSRVSSGNAAR